MTTRAGDHRSSEQRRESKVSGGSCVRGRATGTTAQVERAGAATVTASVTGVTSSDADAPGWLARSIGVALATCVTVQQHAARKIGSGAAGLCFGWSSWVGQQHAERVTRSYMHVYQDAVTLDGTRARTSKIGTTRRTRSQSYAHAARRQPARSRAGRARQPHRLMQLAGNQRGRGQVGRVSRTGRRCSCARRGCARAGR